MVDYHPYAGLDPLPEFELTSSDITTDGTLDGAHFDAAMGGEDVSPQLSWSGFPAETGSFAVTVFDPDAPTGSGFWHWAVFDIPASVTSLERGAGSPGSPLLPAGARTLPNENRRPQFSGAAPPDGTGRHRYFVVVHAVDIEHLDIPADATPAILGFNLHFHGLARGVLTPVASYDDAP